MVYTVKQLAKLSGVSIRTLHFYDEIGLLKPAFYGENNYRYYREEELLLLQQILFYRELNFSLVEIGRIILSDNFDKVEALLSHKKILKTEFKRYQKMITTIDKTISHLRGKITMKSEELYYGFDSEKQKEHEKYLVDQGIVTQEFMDECNKKIKNWNNKQKNDFIHEGEKIMATLIEYLDTQIAVENESVQEIMRQHYIWLEKSWSPTKESYLGLADLYRTEEFRKFFDTRHPELLDYIIRAMKVYANKKL